MKKNKLIAIVAFAFFMYLVSMHAQTKPKTTAKKETAKGYSVYVCTNDRDIYYHKRGTCAGLHKCSEVIKNLKSQAELKKYKKKKACQRCFGK